MAEANVNDDTFVYTGGDQKVVPRDVVRVRIDKSVKIIPRDAFWNRQRLIDVEFHEGIERIEKDAFNSCFALRSVKLLGVKVIAAAAFYFCTSLAEVQFGDKLETIEERAFSYCNSLRNIKIPSIRTIEVGAFGYCVQLTDLDLPEGLETIQHNAFHECIALRRIAIPLRDNLIGDRAFCVCPKLAAVDLVGGIHNTVASLHMESWRSEMEDEINRINQVLPDTFAGEKTAVTQQWIRSVIQRIDQYKFEHKTILKEAATLLELALWKAKMDEKEEEYLGKVKAKKIKLDVQSERSERRVTSGANIVIKNVLPYLELK